MKRSVRPTAAFRSRLMSELSLAYDQKYGCPQRRPFWVRAGSVAMASLALFFTVGTGVYAYESPTVSEGHPLYFVKSGLESVRGGFARSPEERAAFHAEMMERRLEEGEYHLPVEPDQVPPVLDRAADEFEFTITALDEGVDDESTRQQMIDTLSIKRARYLELRARIQGGVAESDEFEPLQMRIEGHRLSEQEFNRLFNSPMRDSQDR